MQSSEHLKLADLLFQSRTKIEPCEPLTLLNPALTIEDAYAISEINLKRRIEQGAARLVGKKIGLTSLAVQKQLGVQEPDFGYLTSDMHVKNGGYVARESMLLPKVEGEVAFILKGDLKGPGITREQVIAATDYVQPCIEIIDSRVKDWKIKIQDTVADNASSAYFVLGEQKSALDLNLRLREKGMALRVNGEVLSTGVGAACLDDPILAVAWLANTMGKFGVSLKAGDIILSGAYGPVVPVQKGDQVEVEISGLGSVSCKF